MDPSQSKLVKTILSLSDEILLNIFHKLEMYDIVQLSETCQRFQRILCDRTICKDLCIPWNIGTSRYSTITFIEQRSSIITSLTLTNITWIPSYLLKRIVLNLPLLKGLHVAGIRFYWIHLHEVLKSSLPILDKLSWTYDCNLEKSIINQRKKLTKQAVEPNRVFDEFLLLREKFQQLKYLLFHLNKDSILRNLRKNYQGISYIVSLCTNLEEFWLIGVLETNAEHYNTDNELWNVDFSKLEFPNLHTLVITPTIVEVIEDDLPEILHYLLDAFHKKNAGNAIDDSKSSAMKLWINPDLFITRTGTGFRRIGVLDFPPGLNLSSLTWLSYELFQTDLDANININLSLQLKKVYLSFLGYRNAMQIHKFIEHAPNLESFACDFETTFDWPQIAVNNSKLKEVTVTGSLSIRIRGNQKFAESCAYIAKLPLLQKISLPLASITDQEIIMQYNSDQELAEILRPQAEDGIMLSTSDGSSNASKQNQHQRPTGLDCLTLNCHNVKEFELAQDTPYCWAIGVEFGNVGMALSNISRWDLLECLTLHNVPVIGDGEFLIKVAKSSKLKSLRLVRLGTLDAKLCTYTKCLYTALKLMPHLKNFGFEQNYIGPVTPLFEALQSCHKLQRLAVFVNQNFRSAPLEASEPLKLMTTSRYLYLFCLSLTSASKASCEFLTKRIIEQFKSSRPALNVLITREIISDSEKEVFFNYVHHCDLMRTNESCFKLWDSY